MLIQFSARYFEKVAISPLALAKITERAIAGGDLEVMGLVCGRIENRAFVVTDAFALPVEGTETHVNAAHEANESAICEIGLRKQIGLTENIVGWFHSHPGYGCWLSGTDVETQRTNQQFQDPFIAIVVDPKKTMIDGKVDIGAFRALPQEHRNASLTTQTDQHVAQQEQLHSYLEQQQQQSLVAQHHFQHPQVHQLQHQHQQQNLDQIQRAPKSQVTTKDTGILKDFGAHGHKYYALDVELVSSPYALAVMDLFLSKSWIKTLAQSASSRLPRSNFNDNRKNESKRLQDVNASIKTAISTVRHLTNGQQKTPVSQRWIDCVNSVRLNLRELETDMLCGLVQEISHRELFAMKR